MLSTLLAAALVAAPADPSVPLPQDTPIDAAALYKVHCASCHGETGDGKGTADLDRPARSFLDGGYSYGNTRTAVLRSVTYGIPGTPMPAFAESLKEDERAALAEFVIGLGPKGTIVEPGTSVLRVGDRPRIVTAMLPAIPGGPAQAPRGLVVGFPNGSTFGYAKSTGELHAVWVGEFLDRRDWGGRGGAPVQPLGARVWTRKDGFGDADQFARKGGARLTRHMVGARLMGDAVRIDFRLEDADGVPLGGGQEFLTFLEVEGVPVAMRTLVATGRADAPVAALPLDVEPVARLAEGTDREAHVRPAGEGVHALDFPALPGVRALVHSTGWSDALEAAVTLSLTTGGR